MASPSGALTMAQMAAAQQTKLLKGTLEVMTNELSVSDILPIRNLGGALTVKYARPNPDNQPAIGLRNVNQDVAFTSGDFESFNEGVALLTAGLKIDFVEQKDPTNLFSPGATQLEFESKQMARRAMNYLLNGDPTQPVAGADGKLVIPPAGVRYRIANLGKYGLDPSVNVNVSYDMTALTNGIANSVLDSVLETIALVDPNVILMNYRMMSAFKRSMRVGGFFATVKDQFDRTFDTFNGIRVVVTGLATAVRNTRNLADTSQWLLPWEDALGNLTPTATAGNRYGSMFFLNCGEMDFCGLTPSGLQQRGPIEAPPPTRAYLYDMEMGLGFTTISYRPIAQISGFKLG